MIIIKNIGSQNPQDEEGKLNRISEHARKRCAQRNLGAEKLDTVLSYAQEIHRTGVIFYFLGKQNIPKEMRRNDCYSKLEGAVLLTSNDGELITAYRNRNAFHSIRRKAKHNYSFQRDYHAGE